MYPVRALATILASVLVLGSQAPVLAQTAPTMGLEPDTGYPGDAFRAKYQWIDCGNLGNGTFVLEIFWETTAVTPLAISAPFDYSGSGPCSAIVDAEVPADATAGGHDVIGQLRASKTGVIAASGVKTSFLVLDKPKPTPTPKPKPTPTPEPTPTPTPEPKPTPTPEPKPTPTDAGKPTSTPEPTNTKPTDTPGTVESPTPDSSKTPEPSDSPQGPATMTPDKTPESSLTTPPEQVLNPVSGVTGEDKTIVGVIVGMAQQMSYMASDLLLGGVTDAMVAMNRGLELAPGPWSRGPNLSNSSGEAVDPDTAATSTTVYVVWADSAEGQWDIMFARSTDHGYSFDRPVNLSQNAGASQHPKIVADGARVTVAWDDDTPGLTSVYTMTSRDAGVSWYAPVVAGIGSSPVVAAGGGNDYIAWAGGLFGNQIFAQRVGGAAVQVTSFDENRNPVIAASDSNVSIAWETHYSPVWDVAFATSWDGAQSWQTNQIAPSHPPLRAVARSCFEEGWESELGPAIAVSGRRILVAFGSLGVAWVPVSETDGRDWTPPARTTGNCGGWQTTDEIVRALLYGNVWDQFQVPAVSISGGVACVAYVAHYHYGGVPNRSHIAAVCGNTGALPFASVIHASASESIDRPAVCCAGAHPAVAWQERNPDASDVWLKVLDGSIQNVSASGGDSTVPRLASSGSNVTVVWTEANDDNRQVYFRTYPDR